MKGNYATIIKDGKITNIEEDDLCIGDVILIQAGDLVPADINIIEAISLEVDEFELTGEILPANKTADDYHNILYKGTQITRGMGKGIVSAVGEQTEYGKIRSMSTEVYNPNDFKLVSVAYLISVSLLVPPFIVGLMNNDNIVATTAKYILLAALFILIQNDQISMRFLVTKELQRYEKRNIIVLDRAIFNTLW